MHQGQNWNFQNMVLGRNTQHFLDRQNNNNMSMYTIKDKLTQKSI